MAAKMTLPGTYVFRFAGFDRADNNARHLAGVGHLVLKGAADKGTIESGRHRATNSPMSGHTKDLRRSEYTLSGTYVVSQAGPPIVGEANVIFTRVTGAGAYKMSDTFAIVQSGPDRLWLMSTVPKQEESQPGKNDPELLAELVIGELIKVDMAAW